MAIAIIQQTVVWILIPLLQRLACGEAGGSKLSTAPSWKILKSFISGALGMFLVVLATTNPSLALALAIPLVPVFTFIEPTQNIFYTAAQSLILIFLSPPILLAIFAFLNQNLTSTILLLSNLYHFWEIFGHNFLFIICVCYWPLNLTAQVLITMDR